MSLKKTRHYVKEALAEFRSVLSTLQECNIAQNIKFEWEEVLPSQCDPISKKITINDDEANKVQVILSAFKRLGNCVLSMEQNVLSTSNINNCLMNNNKMEQKQSIGLRIEQSGSDGAAANVANKEDEVAELEVNSSQLWDRKGRNACKFCRKRFATIQLLNYHLVHLHGVTKPG